MAVFRGFAEANVAAIFEEAEGGGGFMDIAAPRNAPALDPAGHLDLLTWHSDCFQYEIAAKATVSISHASLDGRRLWFSVSGTGGFVNGSTTQPESGIAIAVNGQVRTSTITLLTHGLGYAPLFMVAYGGHSLPNGMIVQSQSGGRGRMVSAFANTSIIGLKEVAWSTNQQLRDVTRSYEVMVFNAPTVVPGRRLMELEGDRLIIGRGKVDTAKQYLRRVKPGESSFDIDRGPTAAYKSGGTRVSTGGYVIDEEYYDGSFVGPGFIAVGV